MNVTPFEQIGELPPTIDAPPFDLEIINGVEAFLPPNQLTCASKVLAQTIRSRALSKDDDTAKELWQQNSGVVAYYQVMLAQSPCFSLLVSEFYNSDEFSFKTNQIIEDDTVNSRPALNAYAGRGSYQSVGTGQFMEKALEITGGDSLLAMEIIGYCGHDDQLQNEFTVVSLEQSSSRESIINYVERSVANRRVLNDSTTNLLEVANNKELNLIRNSNSAGLNISCPKHHSPFYTPGAIHPQLSLPQQTIDLVSRIQAPNEGAGVLPAKNYHMTFSATIGCRLAGCGLSKKNTVKLLKKVAKTYRKKRLKNSIERYRVWKELIERTFDVSWSDPILSTPEFKEKFESWLARQGTYLKNAVGKELFVKNRADLNWDMLRNSIDASLIFQSGMIDRYLKGQSIFSHKNRSMRNCRSLLGERCQIAVEKVETWLTDFVWTDTQQEIGAGFGHEQCKSSPQYDFSDIEQLACQQINLRYQDYECVNHLLDHQ